MGIRYTPILYLGRVFESEEDALAFYQKYFKLFSEEELLDIKSDGFGEWVNGHPTLSFTRTNYYTDNCDYILGFNLKSSVRTPEVFSAAVNFKMAEWKEMFGDEPCNIIHDVCVS